VVRTLDALTDEQAALVEPATVAFHGVRNAGIRLGDFVVVQGCGPIGAIALQVARVCGAGTAMVIEPSPARRALAARLGADIVVHPDDAATTLADITNGLGADVVVECAGVPATVQSAVDHARPGGQVMLIGLSDLPATIHPATWLAKEVVVRGSIAYAHREFEMCMDLIASGRVDVRPVHTSTVALDALDGALQRLADGASDETKILVDLRSV
jgi:(R,R)-butanediol dehydrogenase/meso-butanediol dehydrogenase/diacetyl reductase